MQKQPTEQLLAASGFTASPPLLLQCFLLASAFALCLYVFCPAQTLAQSSATSAPAAQGTPIQKAIDLAATGQCEKALPILKKLAPATTDTQLKYKALTSTVRCGISRQDDETTANALLALERDYPDDPDVLYMSTQFFLELAFRASQHLNTIAPNSYQAQELQADNFESQGKWDEAIAIYRQILVNNPNLRGLHYRMGHDFLAKRDSPTSLEDAKKEFEAEIAIDPVNAASQYWLGEIARRNAQWDEAIAYYQKAIKTNSEFAEAYLGLGTAYNAAGQFEEAIAPLVRYTSLLPDSAAGHYQLSISYTRTGNAQEAERQRDLLRDIKAKAQEKAISEAPAPLP